MRKFVTSSVILLITLTIGIFIGSELKKSHFKASDSKQVRLGEGRLTNPLLECEIASGTIDAEKINFRPELETFIAKTLEKLSVEKISVYFRDLNNGPTFGLNQDDPFIPASLIKVPIMLAYYKLSEIDPAILNEKFIFTEKDAALVGIQQIPPQKTLTIGQTYTAEELIETMIIYSDNASTVLLSKRMPIAVLEHLYKLLGVDEKVVNNPAAALTAKEYSAFFRILYNSSFLSQVNSEKALALLSQTTFNQGLRADIPKNIPVAHKFGERSLAGQQVHDCGIIYYPKHPYLLCVMTRGKSTSSLQRMIQEVSGFVYEKIDSQYTGK